MTECGMTKRTWTSPRWFCRNSSERERRAVVYFYQSTDSSRWLRKQLSPVHRFFASACTQLSYKFFVHVIGAINNNNNNNRGLSFKRMSKRARTSVDKAVVDVWQREVGQLSTRNFAHRLGASEVLSWITLIPSFVLFFWLFSVISWKMGAV